MSLTLPCTTLSPAFIAFYRLPEELWSGEEEEEGSFLKNMCLSNAEATG